MVKKFIFCLLVLVLTVSLVSAIDTEIKIKTLKGYVVQATASKAAGNFVPLENGYFNATSDIYGDVSFTLSSDETMFNLIVFIKTPDTLENVVFKKYVDQVAGELLEIRLASEGFEFVETPAPVEETNIPNETIENETIVLESVENETITEEKGFFASLFGGDETEESAESAETPLEETITDEEIKNEEESGFFSTSFAVLKDKEFLSDKTMYYIGGFILLGLLAFLGFHHREKLQHSVQQSMQVIKKKSDDTDNEDEDIEEAEAKLKEMKEKVERLRSKKKNKIEEIKKRMIEDEKELMRLRAAKKKEDKD